MPVSFKTVCINRGIQKNMNQYDHQEVIFLVFVLFFNPNA